MSYNTEMKRNLGLWLLGTYCLAVMVVVATRGPEKALIVAGMLLIVGMGAWIAILMHEVGHAAAARLRGFDIYCIWVTGIFIFRRKPKLKPPPEFLGVVFASKTNATRKDWVAFFAAGPLMSLALAIPSVIWILELRKPPMTTAEIAAFAFCAGAVYAAVIVVISGFNPMGDFGMLLSLAKQPERTLARLNFNQDLLQRRPRDYRIESLEAVGMPKGQEQLLPLLLYWHFLDAGNIQAAEIHIREAFKTVEAAGVRTFQARPICFEMAMFAARFLGDKELSDRALELGDRAPGQSDQRIGAEAAREYVWGEKSKAMTLAQSQLRKVESDLDEGPLLDHVREWYERIVPELVE